MPVKIDMDENIDNTIQAVIMGLNCLVLIKVSRNIQYTILECLIRCAFYISALTKSEKSIF